MQTPLVDPEIDEALVRGLLEDQHPDLADLPQVTVVPVVAERRAER